jgi:uncharacterized protein YjeT (DUF2065 family)
MAVAVIWCVWTLFTVMGIVTLIPPLVAKATMAPILMWSFCALYLVGGLISLASPGTVREMGRTFLTNATARIAGIGYMIVGAALFRVASSTSLPLLAQIIGVGAFVKGGVQLLLPVFAITVIEWWRDLPDLAFRLFAICAFVMAGLFAYAAGHHTGGPAAPVAPAAQQAAPPAAAPQPTGLPAVLPPPPAQR